MNKIKLTFVDISSFSSFFFFFWFFLPSFVFDCIQFITYFMNCYNQITSFIEMIVEYVRLLNCAIALVRLFICSGLIQKKSLLGLWNGCCVSLWNCDFIFPFSIRISNFGFNFHLQLMQIRLELFGRAERGIFVQGRLFRSHIPNELFDVPNIWNSLWLFLRLFSNKNQFNHTNIHNRQKLHPEYCVNIYLFSALHFELIFNCSCVCICGEQWTTVQYPSIAYAIVKLFEWCAKGIEYRKILLQDKLRPQRMK